MPSPSHKRQPKPSKFSQRPSFWEIRKGASVEVRKAGSSAAWIARNLDKRPVYGKMVRHGNGEWVIQDSGWQIKCRDRGKLIDWYWHRGVLYRADDPRWLSMNGYHT